MSDIEKRTSKSIKYIRKFFKGDCKVGMILGSGLGVIADSFKDPIEIPYKNIPYFPVSTVKGHAGTLIFGKVSNYYTVVMNGRFHYYEGYGMDEITYPVRVMSVLGVKKMIVTNACGGINKGFKTGDLMVITDHINLMGNNPLRGWKQEKIAPRFIDMTYAYSLEMIRSLQRTAQKKKIILRKGVYAALFGPSYETPAEIRMLKTCGADAVGMSTVPEVIVANQLHMDVCGISLITNMAAGILKKRLNHKEVLEVSKKAQSKVVDLIRNFLAVI
ncbi:MAG: purine-nucleoside phosphorylase [Spirochaetes bacterium]|nr:purine-nucleoside phosphorylase [Spirochaetota bacterium]